MEFDIFTCRRFHTSTNHTIINFKFSHFNWYCTCDLFTPLEEENHTRTIVYFRSRSFWSRPSTTKYNTKFFWQFHRYLACSIFANFFSASLLFRANFIQSLSLFCCFPWLGVFSSLIMRNFGPLPFLLQLVQNKRPWKVWSVLVTWEMRNELVFVQSLFSQNLV